MAGAPAAPPLQLDARAWEDCVSNLHRELGRIASREDCQDAVQDALTDALRRPGLSVDNLGGWVVVIARRRLLDDHRAKVGRSKDKRKRRTFVPAEADDLAEQRISTTELVELLENGAARDASEALARLSGEQQRLLTLSLEQTQYPEVAEIFGITPKAAKERTRRAWNALRQAFIETARDEPGAQVRRMLVRRRSRGAAGEEERRALIAHLETCLPCRAYEKRMKGLIATSPGPTFPFWQQLIMRLEQLLAGSPTPRSVETIAAKAIATGNSGSGLARMLATLCAGATAAGMCAAVVVSPPAPNRKNEARQEPRATVTAVAARISPSPTPTAVR